MTIADINQEIRDLCDADTTTYTASTLLRRVNNALETLVGLIINADGTWQWDDSNYSTLPIGTGTLVEGQTSYSFSDEFLDIEEVSVLDAGGVWRKLKPVDPSELGDLSIEEYFGIKTSSTPKGLPEYYDKQEDTVKLYPAPAATAVTLSSGLRVRFKRTADLFTSAQVTTGTKVPGIASPYHMLICYLAAIPYCMGYKKDRVALYKKQADQLTEEMLTFYGQREKDRRKVMTMASISYI